MKRLILIALIPTLVGCAGLSQQQEQGLGTFVGAFAGYNLGQGHKHQSWAMLLGALSGIVAGSYRLVVPGN